MSDMEESAGYLDLDSLPHKLCSLCARCKSARLAADTARQELDDQLLLAPGQLGEPEIS